MNKKIKTVFGYLNNNRIKHKITRHTATLFNFSIEAVTVEDDTLMVLCKTITNKTIQYVLDLDNNRAELTPELFNYTTGGNIIIFLAIVWKIYEMQADHEVQIIDTDGVDDGVINAVVGDRIILSARVLGSKNETDKVEFYMEE